MAAEDLRMNDARYRESAMQQMKNNIGVLFLKGIAALPFFLLYALSDFMYIIVRYVVGYRVKVVAENLRNSFPEKTDEERKQILNKYFRHMCDLILEGVKLYRMDSRQLEKRVKFVGIEEGHRLYKENKSIIVLAMHHNNWEWSSYMANLVDHWVLMVYNPIRGNMAMENFLEKSRTKWGGEHVPVNKTARTAVNYMAKGKRVILWLAADQTPGANSRFWTTFMNQETPFFTGPEKIAIRSNQPIFFQHVTKTGRGKYTVKLKMLIEEPAKYTPEEIMLTYVRKMEEVIRQEPEYYLWSHRRWKHTRPEGTKLVEK